LSTIDPSKLCEPPSARTVWSAWQCDRSAKIDEIRIGQSGDL
jgi:hypothetical protein